MAPAEPAKADEPGTAAEPFKFTENADPETFAKEKAAWLETVEITPELQQVIDYQDAQIAALAESAKTAAASPAADPATVDHMEAFNKLVTFRLDPDTQVHVPDTSGVISMMDKYYPNEKAQVVQDLVSAASTKYAGLTVMQEYIRDGFGLSPQAMATLDTFLNNGGTMPFPSFVPAGIDVKLAEAYWTSPDRDAYDQTIDKALYTLQSDPDATDAEKESARGTLKNMNSTLSIIQNGLTAARNTAQAERAQQTNAQKAIESQAEVSFFETTTGLVSQFSDRLAKAFPEGMMDATGAQITGLSYATLVEKAFTDDDSHSKHAQAQLAKHGIEFDWAKGRTALDRLWDIENVIAAQTAAKANPRALDISRQAKDGIIQELQNLETELSGKIVAKVVTGNAKAVAAKTNAAPKTSAVRAKNPGPGITDVAKPNFENMELGELRKYVTENNPYAAAARGDLSGFR